MNPFRRLLCHVAPILCALAVSYVLIALIGDRYQPRDVLEVHINPAAVEQGRAASVVFTAIDDRHCNGVVHRYLVDATGIQYGLPDSVAYYNDSTTRGVQFRFAREFLVPVNAAPGIATYNSQTVRWCNIFQQYVWPMTDEYKATFTIIPKK